MNSWLGMQIIERCIVMWNKFHTVTGVIILFMKINFFFVFSSKYFLPRQRGSNSINLTQVKIRGYLNDRSISHVWNRTLNIAIKHDRWTDDVLIRQILYLTLKSLPIFTKKKKIINCYGIPLILPSDSSINGTPVEQYRPDNSLWENSTPLHHPCQASTKVKPSLLAPNVDQETSGR